MRVRTFTAVDLRQMTPQALQFRPQPIRLWPTTVVNVDEVGDTVCIASWRRDVRSIDEISNNLSECAWDALHLGFSFLLCDIVALPQDDPTITEQIIAFSELYGSLHAVISYQVDPEIRRTWLKNEAYRILQSPTLLLYAYEKWQLSVPLICSLVINQICKRRLGLREINTSKLSLCDTPDAADMTLADLQLLDGVSVGKEIANINLDRVSQAFASDVLLVYELNLSKPREVLIARLRSLRSNSVAVPALLIVWAMIEGLSVSVMGADWRVDAVGRFTEEILDAACGATSGATKLVVERDQKVFNLNGLISAKAILEHKSVSELHLGDAPPDLFVRCRKSAAKAEDPSSLISFLGASLSYVEEALAKGTAAEPPPPDLSIPRYTLFFDNTPGHETAPGGTRVSLGGHAAIIRRDDEVE